jgi:ABC-type thiamin/hydroxymethylpyrimidine transport system permease subunit
MNIKQNNDTENEGSSKSNDIYRKTGFISKDNKKLTNLDLIYSTTIGILGGIISSLIPFSLLIKVWYPFTGGTQLVSGHHVIWASIIYGLTKKKPNILITMLAKGLLEFLFGDPWGLLIIFVNLTEALCLAGGFWLMESIGEGETKLGWAIAGALGNFVQAPFFWIINQRWYLHWSLWLLAFIFAFISGIVIVGLLGRAIKNSLIKAGVPTTF